MTRLVTVAQMRAIERAADAGGLSYARMMENAGRAVAEAILERTRPRKGARATVLCGPGNNGGDGLVAAHYLAEAGVQVSCYLTRARPDDDPLVARLRDAGRGLLVADAENDQRWRVLTNLLAAADILVDAVLGTGIELPVKGLAGELLFHAGRLVAGRERPPLVVAVDCPSGVDCDSGAADALALRADLTITMAAARIGLFRFPAADLAGEVVVADIGLPDDLPELQALTLELATPQAVAASLPPRPRDAHKGTFGRALICAGSVNYTGAAYLAGAAAYRIGAGLVTLAVPAAIYPILAAQLPEATWLTLPQDMGVIAAPAASVLGAELDTSQALLLGPGFGQEKATAAFLRRLLGTPPHAGPGAAGGEQPENRVIGFAPRPARPDSRTWRLPPTVVDADGLKLLAALPDWPARLPAPAVLTPHPGEMAVLCGLEKEAIQADRMGVALRFAREWGHVVVLKGAFTVVASPDERATLIPFATPALARAGTGDVLAGAIVGLLAQGMDPYRAAVAGAYLHALAGELAASELGTTASVLAGDVLDMLPAALASGQNRA